MPNISGNAIEVRLLLLVSAVFLALVVSPARAQCDDSDAAVETCELLDSCIVRLRAIAQAHEREKSRGMGEQQCRIAERIRSLPGAVDALIPLLADPDIEVAELAAYVLRDVESIDPRHLPQVKAGLDRKLGWLPPALARMDNDEAAREAVARLLVSDSAPQNQYSYAVELVGARAIPHVVSAARCTGGCKSSNDHYYLGYALGKWARRVLLQFRDCWKLPKIAAYPMLSQSVLS